MSETSSSPPSSCSSSSRLRSCRFRLLGRTSRALDAPRADDEDATPLWSVNSAPRRSSVAEELVIELAELSSSSSSPEVGELRLGLEEWGVVRERAWREWEDPSGEAWLPTVVGVARSSMFCLLFPELKEEKLKVMKVRMKALCFFDGTLEEG